MVKGGPIEMVAKRKPKPMSKTAYRKAIELVGLSQVKASDFFEVSRKTSPRWARGEAPIPGAVRKLLRIMISKEISPEEVDKFEERCLELGTRAVGVVARRRRARCPYPRQSVSFGP